MTDKRPVNLNLFKIHFPIPAIISILHRVSGVLLFIFVPFLLWGFHLSLHSQAGYDALMKCADYFITRFFLWAFLSALVYHLLAGCRHLLMDMHIGESLAGGRCGALIVAIISIALIVLMGVWLW